MATFEEVADALRLVAAGRSLPSVGRRIELEHLGLAKFPPIGSSGEATLTERGDAFDRAWTVFGDRDTAEQLLRESYLGLPATNALMQGIHGRPSVAVEGALHLLARHRLADADDATTFRGFLQALNDLGIVAYSRKHQSVRVVAPLPTPEPAEPEQQPAVRIVEPDRPYSNVRHLRETLRACRDFIWWADPHFEKRGFEPLADEADASRVQSIRILSGTRPSPGDVSDYERFKAELESGGISVEFRVVAPPDREWHDRYIVTRDAAWNVPGLGVITKGSYSEFTKTALPPFESWWQKGTPVEDL